MGKSRRSYEENKRISAATVTLLVIFFLLGISLLIYVLFSKAECDKKISSLNDQIEMLKLESSNLNDKKEEINNILSEVENASTYIKIDHIENSIHQVIYLADILLREMLSQKLEIKNIYLQHQVKKLL